MKVGIPVVVMASLMLAFGADALLSPEDQNQEVPNRKELELELSFLKLRKDLLERDASIEEIRLEDARWRAANVEKIALARKQEESGDDIAPEPIVVGAVPTRGESSAADFLSEAKQYRERLAKSVARTASENGSIEDVRRAVHLEMSKPAITALGLEVRLAMEDLAGETSGPRTPLGAAEVAALPPGKRAKEEIYAAVYNATRKPLAEGEQFRDRLAPLKNWIIGKEAEIDAAQLRPTQEVLIGDRITVLEQELEELEQ